MSERRWTKLDNGMVWQNPLREASSALEHKLRYQCGHITESDLLAAADLISCYRSLVNANRERRQQVVAALRRDAP
jgi:hypothetical protein